MSIDNMRSFSRRHTMFDAARPSEIYDVPDYVVCAIIDTLVDVEVHELPSFAYTRSTLCIEHELLKRAFADANPVFLNPNNQITFFDTISNAACSIHAQITFITIFYCQQPSPQHQHWSGVYPSDLHLDSVMGVSGKDSVNIVIISFIHCRSAISGLIAQ